MYDTLRPLLFTLPPEVAHNAALQSLSLRSTLLPLRSAPVIRSREVMGLRFANPLGLAAGLDKNGDHIDGLGSLGFGFVEIGTVTPKPQPGNPKPRLFRLPKAKAIINRMGFNNLGVDHLVAQVSKRRYAGVLGINIGKNFATPIERAEDDYLYCLRKVYAVADYVTVNISSPNTPGLRDLQHGERLQSLLRVLKQEQEKLSQDSQRYVPLVVKVAPDLDAREIADMAGLFNEAKIDGLIATNTTSSREAVQGLPYADEAGGLSGAPVFVCSTEVMQQFRQRLDESIAVIAAGGVSSSEDVKTKLQAGADLVQLYTGLIYQGPGLVREILKTLRSESE